MCRGFDNEANNVAGSTNTTISSQIQFSALNTFLQMIQCDMIVQILY